jgi:aerobic carbon-monoxide dehydrogenase medium subunit
MKPAPFTYRRAETLDQALALLAENGDEAKILAGGQSLVPLMNMRLALPGVLVDICAIDELSGIRENGVLEIGATTRQSAVEQSAQVAAAAPMIPAALAHVGHVAIRNRGTFGGSVAHADPAAELPAVLVALDAQIVARGAAGERVIAADDFFETYFSTALREDEVLTAVRIPRATGADRWAFEELAPRRGDFALAGVAVSLRMAGESVERARIVVLGVGDAPVRARAAEELVTGMRPDDDVAAEAGRLCAAELDPSSDTHASSAYRKDVAAVLVKRAISAATGGP